MYALLLATLLAIPNPPAPAGAHGELYVLAINGGGDKLDNFASHVAHLRQLVEVLRKAGVAEDHIRVLASDGADPSLDVVSREQEPEGTWLLEGTRLGPILRDLPIFENTQLPGIALQPATLAGLSRTITELKTRLHPGDTLLVYVTDHGTQSRGDPLDNQITLWGAHEAISVRRLGALLARLPAKVRVVSLMSQCFSGGFAYLHEAREHQRMPSGATCGFFSSSPDRPAYGCYPEVRGQKGIGHSFQFLSALTRRGNFLAAHAEVLVSDETPDIPLRSSDVYLAELLSRQSRASRNEIAFTDDLLTRAWASGHFAEESDEIDRIAAAYATARPASLAELDQRVQEFFNLLDRLEAQAKAWESALGDFNQATLDSFLAHRPDWHSRLDLRTLRLLGSPARREVVNTLLTELARFLATSDARQAQANRLVTALTTMDEISYRTEIRVAALLRIRFVFTSVAGRHLLQGNPSQARAVEALLECESLSLPMPPSAAQTPRSHRPTFPSLAEDQRRASLARPGWLGITFAQVSVGQRKRFTLPDGAAHITAIAARSPAAKVELRPGDIVIGMPGYTFTLPNELRPVIASTNPGSPIVLDVLRGTSRLKVRAIVGQVPPASRARN